MKQNGTELYGGKTSKKVLDISVNLNDELYKQLIYNEIEISVGYEFCNQNENKNWEI